MDIPLLPMAGINNVAEDAALQRGGLADEEAVLAARLQGDPHWEEQLTP